MYSRLLAYRRNAISLHSFSGMTCHSTSSPSLTCFPAARCISASASRKSDKPLAPSYIHNPNGPLIDIAAAPSEEHLSSVKNKQESPSANDFVEIPADIYDSDKTHAIANPFLHHDPEPIPELPMDIEVHARHITLEHMEQYIQPLYTRRWGIGVSRVKYSRGDSKISRLLPQLSKGFSFVHYATVLKFASEIMSIASEEKHQAQVVINDNVVHVNTRTIQAWPRLTVPAADSIKPAVTLRDIRLAILVERNFTESYEPDGSGSSVYIGKTQPSTPRAIGETVMANIRHFRSMTKRPKRRFRGRECTICGRNGHHMVNCPRRFITEPHKPCPLCNGMHWKINCPSLLPQAPTLPVAKRV
ncbi:hypothetical protein PILCRDRAFT_659628 [Piloderma croceum F 1598]|uniref:CCHC-type domain-containing protein n=1 Tax=Piloderma croceum (strain F 1598) TaxID=765440 RepID=A0A0C3F7P5_PILCF|nr:hypothetical protein PILCRDRAFT_659628 [Piloderma croceum F 1598]